MRTNGSNGDRLASGEIQISPIFHHRRWRHRSYPIPLVACQPDSAFCSERCQWLRNSTSPVTLTDPALPFHHCRLQRQPGLYQRYMEPHLQQPASSSWRLDGSGTLSVLLLKARPSALLPLLRQRRIRWQPNRGPDVKVLPDVAVTVNPALSVDLAYDRGTTVCTWRQQPLPGYGNADQWQRHAADHDGLCERFLCHQNFGSRPPIRGEPGNDGILYAM